MRHEAEGAPRRADNRQAFLLRLDDHLRSFSDIAEIELAASRLLGEELALDRVAYAAVDQAADTATATQEWTRPGLSSVLGVHRLSAFGPELIRQLSADEAIVVSDVRADPRTRDVPAIYKSLHARALVSVPLIRHGTVVSSLTVHSAAPRDWTGAEVDLVREVARRTWEAAERARSEQALRQSEERFRTMMEQSPLSMQIFDAEGRTLAVNAAWERLWNAGREALDDYNILQDKQLQASGLMPHIRRAFAGEVVTLPETHYDPGEIGKEGRSRWIAGYIYPLTVGDGGVSEVALVHHDITDRKQAEAALRQSEDTSRRHLSHLQTIYGSAPIGLTFLDRDLRYISMNRVMAEIDGLPVEQIIGRTLREILPGEIADSVEPLYRQVIDGGKAIDNVEIRGKTRGSGRERDFLASYHPVKTPDGHVLGVNAAIQDITDRKRAEIAIRESKARALLALEVAAIGTWSWHPVPDEVIADARCREICGLEPDAPLSLANIVPRVHPEDRTRVEAALGAAIEPEGAGRYYEEFRFIEAGGAVRWVVSRGQTLFEGTGEARRVSVVLGTVMDITERKRAEEALREADRRKDEFLATLAHELRDPLAPLRSMLEVMQRADGDVELIAKARDTMERQLGHIVRLVDDLLDIGRITRDRLELRHETVELALVVKQAIESARPTAESRQHELTVSLPPGQTHLHGDPVRLTQIFSNLLSNACKYTPQGGRIWLEAERLDAEVAVRVRDTGIGIPADRLPTIFAMFTQAERPVDRSDAGLGIGLTLVRRLVEMHGGAVKAFSGGSGKGSEFVVILPILTTTPELSTSEPSAISRHAAPRRILVADDNPDSAESLATLLTIHGNQTYTAHDGLEAVKAAERFRPDVVLLDIGMPKLNGREACRRIREQPWGETMVLVAVTGWGQDEDRHKTEAAGFDHHLVKPVGIDALTSLLASLPAAEEAQSTKS